MAEGEFYSKFKNAGAFKGASLYNIVSGGPRPGKTPLCGGQGRMR
jgi:hypothetical protein